MAPVSDPRNGIVVPTAPSTLKYAVPVGSTAAVMPMKPLSVNTPPIDQLRLDDRLDVDLRRRRARRGRAGRRCPGGDLKIVMVGGSPGRSSGRNASGIVNVLSCSVVLNISVTLPVALKMLPDVGQADAAARRDAERAGDAVRLDHEETGHLAVGDARVADAERQLAGQVHVEARGLFDASMLRKNPPCTRKISLVVPGHVDDRLADELERRSCTGSA